MLRSSRETAVSDAGARRPGAQVSVIGLGAMGGAIARTLLEHGHLTTVWNRSAERAHSLTTRGAILAVTPEQAVLASPLVIVCVLDYRAVHEILDPLGESLAGRVLVNLTSGTPREARATSRWAAGQGAEYLDGGIMAIPPAIGGPDARLLYSGSEAAFAAHEHELGRLGTSTFLGPDPGLAPLFDVALLSAMYGMFGGALHAMALVSTAQVRAEPFMALLGSWLQNMASSLPHLAQRIDAGDYTTGVTSNLAMQATAFLHLLEASEAQGVSTELLRPMDALIKARVGEGHGAEDLAGLVELIRRPRPPAG